jgi:hypothetical protein
MSIAELLKRPFIEGEDYGERLGFEDRVIDPDDEDDSSSDSDDSDDSDDDYE